MSKRHLSKNTVANIGYERINILTALSEEATKEGKNDRARRYVTIAKNISMKTRQKFPENFKYCKKCLLPMMPGVNCTIRLTSHKIVSCCKDCGTTRRMPYNRERTK
ncbi:MAG: ribonuclease P protein component 4 [Candidatus Methanomethylophilaceae archaeon]|nr:ribonuclease P protein component 4 [Candidatus Methanomethylophilaceae archaeon]